MPRPKLLIIGKDGYLGSHLFHSPTLNEVFEITGAARVSGIHIDLSEPDSFSEVGDFLKTQSPHYMVITAAVSDVEKCAREPSETRKINVDGMQALLELARTHKVIPIFFSSDYAMTPLYEYGLIKEDDEAKPATEYGRQKRAIEIWIGENFDRHLIFRTSKLMGHTPHPRSILSQVTEAFEKGATVKAFVDQWITPVFVEDIAAVLAHPKLHELSGTYHLATETVFTRYELACLLRDPLKQNGTVEKIHLSDIKTLEERPKYNTLDAQKIRTALGFRFQEILQKIS